MTHVHTCLWFNGQGRQAAELYTSLVPGSSITGGTPNPGDPAGEPLVVEFTLGGQKYQALNGGPDFTLNEAASIVLTCPTQEEADRYWDALTADGGEESMCGWLKDRFGLSWQILPQPALDLFADPDPEVVAKAMQAMFTMRRLDSAEMARAAGKA